MDLKKENIYISAKSNLHIEAAKHICEIGLNAVKKNGTFNIALSGGSTPAPLYEYLATKMKDKFPWKKTHIFLVDERCVPLSSKDRNYLMIKKTILDNVKIRAENIHNMPDDLSKPTDSAIKYEDELKKHFKNKLPQFDLIIMGIGNDGHTASLFPENKKDLEEKNRWVIGVYAKNGTPPGHRLTLTFKIINNSKNIIFFVTESTKKDIIYEILVNKDKNIPSVQVKPKGRLIWFIDNDAGELIKKDQ